MMISEDVITTIVNHAVLEVEGIDSLATRKGKAIKVAIGEDNMLNIDCNVAIKYGYSVVTVAQAAQTSITNAVESMTGVQVTNVNVNVLNIARQ